MVLAYDINKIFRGKSVDGSQISTTRSQSDGKMIEKTHMPFEK